MESSSRFPWLNIQTDGKPRQRHARLVLDVISALRSSGIKNINASHARDGGYNKRLPLCFKKHRYDIAFLDNSGELILIEVMRTYQTASPLPGGEGIIAPEAPIPPRLPEEVAGLSDGKGGEHG